MKCNLIILMMVPLLHLSACGGSDGGVETESGNGDQISLPEGSVSLLCEGEGSKRDTAGRSKDFSFKFKTIIVLADKDAGTGTYGGFIRYHTDDTYKNDLQVDRINGGTASGEFLTNKWRNTFQEMREGPFPEYMGGATPKVNPWKTVTATDYSGSGYGWFFRVNRETLTIVTDYASGKCAVTDMTIGELHTEHWDNLRAFRKSQIDLEKNQSVGSSDAQI